MQDKKEQCDTEKKTAGNVVFTQQEIIILLQQIEGIRRKLRGKLETTKAV